MLQGIISINGLPKIYLMKRKKPAKTIKSNNVSILIKIISFSQSLIFLPYIFQYFGLWSFQCVPSFKCRSLLTGRDYRATHANEVLRTHFATPLEELVDYQEEGSYEWDEIFSEEA